MRLIVLGCSGSGPGPTSPASGYLVEAGDTRLTLDLGNGTFGPLQRHTDPWALDGVVFSHLHPDHCADFSALAVHRRYHPSPPFDPRARRLPQSSSTTANVRSAAPMYATCESRNRWGKSCCWMRARPKRVAICTPARAVADSANTP